MPRLLFGRSPLRRRQRRALAPSAVLPRCVPTYLEGAGVRRVHDLTALAEARPDLLRPRLYRVRALVQVDAEAGCSEAKALLPELSTDVTLLSVCARCALRRSDRDEAAEMARRLIAVANNSVAHRRHAVRPLWRAHRRREALTEARNLQNAFPSWRSWLLVWTLPGQSMSTGIRFGAIAFFLVTAVLSIVSGRGWPWWTVPALVVAVYLVVAEIAAARWRVIVGRTSVLLRRHRSERAADGQPGTSLGEDEDDG